MGISGLALTGGRAADGGAIASRENLTITDSTISGNTADFGGGISNSGSGTATVMGSTIADNSTGYHGGGIWNDGTTTITDSTISGNSATAFGGGIYNSGTVTVTSSAIGNSAGNSGGGINNESGTRNRHQQHDLG